jgi:hypothetical protein
MWTRFDFDELGADMAASEWFNFFTFIAGNPFGLPKVEDGPSIKILSKI